MFSYLTKCFSRKTDTFRIGLLSAETRVEQFRIGDIAFSRKELLALKQLIKEHGL